MAFYRSHVLVSVDPECLKRGAHEVIDALNDELIVQDLISEVQVLENLPADQRLTISEPALPEGAKSVLPPFDPKLQRYTHKHLEKLGVEIRLNTMAVDMDHESITIKDRTFTYCAATIGNPHCVVVGRVTPCAPLFFGCAQ